MAASTESLVQVNSGTGPKLHGYQRTVGANDVIDEYVVPGESSLPTYMVPTYALVSTATANSHLLQIMAGATLHVRIKRIEIYQMAMATAAAMMQIHLIRLTTAGTGGTAYSQPQADPGDAAAGLTSMALPTVKGTEGNILQSASVYMMQTIGASTPLVGPSFRWVEDPRAKPILIPAGTANGLAIKNITAIAAGTVIINITAVETSYL